MVVLESKSKLIQVLLYLLYISTYSNAQFPPNRPDITSVIANGARSMSVTWTYINSVGSLPPTGFRIIIASTSEGRNKMGSTTVPDSQARSYVITGITPYQYFSSSGVHFSVMMTAYNSFGTSEESSPSIVILPPCPGTCDYRYYTIDRSSCGIPSRCVCNGAYSGTNCDRPNYFPTNVEAVFTVQADGDTPELIVKWDFPRDIDLDGRIASNFTVSVYTLTSQNNALNIIFSSNFIPNPDENGRNVRTLRETVFSATYSSFNYIVVVTTITDVFNDTASAPNLTVATHTPGPVMNLSIGSVTHTSITLNWDPPIDADGLLTSYSMVSGSTTITVPPNSVTATLSNLVPRTAYTIRVFGVNTVGSGRTSSITATTQDNICPVGTFGLPTDIVCTACPLNSVSPAGSQDITECDCSRGYQRENEECNPCPLGTYKNVDRDTLCTSCPQLVTTTAIGSVFPSSCSVCQFTEGSYPEDKCYYFNNTLPLTVTVEDDFDSPAIRLTWPAIPDTVTGYNKNIQNFTQDASVTQLRITCSSTGRGLVPEDYNYLKTRVTALISFRVISDLLGLVEYTCTVEIGATISGVSAFGPPSSAALIVTSSNENTTASLPFVVDVNMTSNVTIVVEYRTDPNLVELISSLTLIYSYPNIDPDDQTDISISVPLQLNGYVTISGIFPNETISISLSTSIGGRYYITTSTILPFLPAPMISQNESMVINSTKILLVWTPIGGSTGYRIFLNSNGLAERIVEVRDNSVMSYVISDLRPFALYVIEIAGVRIDGSIGEVSLQLSISTPEALPGPPTDVGLVEIRGLINITWKIPRMPNGIITGYTVIIVSDTEIKSSSFDSNTFYALFSKPDSTYTVNVQAQNSVGIGESSTAIDLTPTDSLPLFTLIIPVAAGGGGFLLICCVVLLMILLPCCYSHRRKKKGRVEISLLQTEENPYREGSHKNGVVIPLKEVVDKTEEKLSPPPPPPPLTYVNIGAVTNNPPELPEEQYAEISSDQRRLLSNYNLSSSSVGVSEEVSPSDYGNEELYMEMQKIYFEDVDQSNSLDTYEFDRSALEFGEELGHGEFGRVFKASAINIIPGESTSIVAVKMLKDGSSDSIRKNFLGEAQMLAKFGSHPNVMGLLKVVRRSNPQLVITWYMAHGDLRHYLRKCTKETDAVGLVQQLSISIQIAAGMEFLAGKYFIHRDLAARNVLVGENNLVKISDFGLSRALAKDDSYYKLSQTLKLPVKWMAVESLLYQKFSSYSDVWSFGILLWEIFSFGETPYKGIKSMNIAHHVQLGNRLSCPEGCPVDIYQMMQECWRETKEERPTFTQLKRRLKAQATH